MEKLNHEQIIERTISKMKMIGLSDKAINTFIEKEGECCLYLNLDMTGMTPKEINSIKQEIEEEFSIKIFYMSCSFLMGNIALNCLYTSSNTEDEKYTIEVERNSMFTEMSYVYNIDVPEFSEFGNVRYMKAGDSLMRAIVM